ncbi:unnamed protein product [Blepharisma stoltei]|uniref:Uncharacterized protein n=1 Tax=Blepharisma stoltei TaxID=1481888 RepID=A0AAU9IWZ3_9CILI|nr:unnamed protein product [Blepharisma stoltei]
MALFAPKVRKCLSCQFWKELQCERRFCVSSSLFSAEFMTAGVEAKMEAWCNGWWHGDSTWYRAKISVACIGGASR